MKICVPVNQDKGLQSEVCAHFGSAPFFMIVNTDSGDFRIITNTHQHHGHGMCRPLAALAGEDVEGMVVGGIGRGAWNKLRAAQVEVYLSEFPTVEETLSAFRGGTLRPIDASQLCGGHHHGPHGHGPHGGQGGSCHGHKS